MNLVIVESPTKAKTISKFLGRDFRVESSMGHIRDLPKSKMGVDVDNGFTPTYVIPKDKSMVVTALKRLAAKAGTVYLATDEDREGEAISWHLTEALALPENKRKRITFHEITKTAIERALLSPRDLDLRLVDAQQARRVLDRLVGYELSPLLWKKVARGLSAGRVQSVAVRLIVEREREIQAFKPQEYWTIETRLAPKGDKEKAFSAHLQSIGGKAVEKFDLTNEQQVKGIIAKLEGKNWIVSSVTSKKTSRKPQPPFTTSTLQQEANRKLGFSAKQTMMFAQQLYEGVELGNEGSVGLITYMRTDSVNLADKFLQDAKRYLTGMGNGFVKQAPRTYATKSKLAQEAHEAIRPTEAARAPDTVRSYLSPEQWRLYDLIWRRALASQMPDAELNQTILDTRAGDYTFRASGSVITFEGYLRLYPDAVKENLLPKLNQGDAVMPVEDPKGVQHFTEPKPRYSEASLIKTLEELGIGRPSTYAPTISTIQERNYVVKEDKRLKPTDIGILVNDLLVEHFPTIVDYQFTAKMEDELDDVARGERAWTPVLQKFYAPFKERLKEKEQTLSKKELTTETTDEVCDKCGKPMVIRLGRFGKFLACTGYPECKNTKPLPGNNGVGAGFTSAQQTDITSLQEKYKDEKCATCGSPMVVKVGRYGPFLSCSRYPECKTIKNIEQSTGVKCPQCSRGDIIVKRSKFGKPFYTCNQYPDCKYALWSKPTGEQCPQCKSLLLFGAKGTVRCSNKECKYKKESNPEQSSP